MPMSAYEGKPWTVDKIKSIDSGDLLFILDVGAGSGMYEEILRSSGVHAHMTALEIWEPYIKEFNLEQRYDAVLMTDIRDYVNFNFDVVILGDILEHMSKQEAQSVWEMVSRKAKYAVISIPIIHMPQDAVHGNPYEKHVKDDWSHEEVLSSFSGIEDFFLGEIVGVYWAKF